MAAAVLPSDQRATKTNTNVSSQVVAKICGIEPAGVPPKSDERETNIFLTNSSTCAKKAVLQTKDQNC